MSAGQSWGGVRCTLMPVALAAAALHPPASAQQSLFKVVSGHEYREVIDPKHPVSGHTVVGASLVAAAGAPLRTRQMRGSTLWFYVTQPLQANDQVRVDLDSPDGRFHGTGMWQLEKPIQANTWIHLPLPLKPAELRRPELPEGHLAVSVRVFAGGQSASPRPFAAVLDTQDKEAPAHGDMEIWLQVNARRAQMLVRGNAGASARKCEPVASASVVRFDTLCKIATSQLERTPQGRYRLTLLRRDGFSYTPESVELEMK